MARTLCCTSCLQDHFCIFPPYCRPGSSRICAIAFGILSFFSALLLGYGSYLIITDRLHHTEGRNELIYRIIMIVVCSSVFMVGLAIAFLSMWRCCQCRFRRRPLSSLSDYDDEIRWGFDFRPDLINLEEDEDEGCFY